MSIALLVIRGMTANIRLKQVLQLCCPQRVTSGMLSLFMSCRFPIA
jgi:hypothetical protein